MRVLVVGGGGREHAIVRALGALRARAGALLHTRQRRDRRRRRGLDRRREGRRRGRRSTSRVDLVVVGPEVPLVAGSSTTSRTPASPPSARAPPPPGSRARSSTPRRRWRRPACRPPSTLAASREQALAHLAGCAYPVVLKADGLAAGKGVIIAADRGRGDARRSRPSSPSSASAPPRSLIEEYLEGEELSLLAICDGENVVPLAPAQDYKRIFDGDRGPNTGGMGSYSPVPGVDDDARRADRRRRSTEPIVELMAERGRPVPRRPLRGADDDRRRAEGARVQLPLRRSRDPGGAAAAALRPRRPLPRRPRARRARRDGGRVRRRLGGDPRPRLARAIRRAPRRAT